MEIFEGVLRCARANSNIARRVLHWAPAAPSSVGVRPLWTYFAIGTQAIKTFGEALSADEEETRIATWRLILNYIIAYLYNTCVPFSWLT